MEMPKYCDMRGMLSFQILWLLNRKAMCGEELADELEKKRGNKPNPGTIYPALKSLMNAGLIEQKRVGGRKKEYSLNMLGEKELSCAYEYFKQVFGDIMSVGLKTAPLVNTDAIETEKPVAEPIREPYTEESEKKLDDIGIDYI